MTYSRQGYHQDLRLLRNHWLILEPSVVCLLSDSNEAAGTLGSFQEMGHRLALEVRTYLESLRRGKGRWKVQGGQPYCLQKLSFVGHSIGNLIIRAALAGRPSCLSSLVSLSFSLFEFSAFFPLLCVALSQTL